MKHCLLLLALFGCFPFCSFGQFSDDFSSESLGSWLQIPSNRWNATVDNGNFVLHHCYDNSSAGRDYITSKVVVSSYENGKLTWRFRVKHGYSPSSSNGWAFILASDTDATGLYNASQSSCLVVGVNFAGSDDLLKIWEQTSSSTGSKSVKVISSSTLNWESSVGTSAYGYVEVVRNANGDWSIGYSKLSFSDITSIGTFSYTNPIHLNNLGVVYWYTATADQKLWVDDISLSYVETNTVDKDSELRSDTMSDTVVASTAESRNVTALTFSIVDKGTKDGMPTIVEALEVYVHATPKIAFKPEAWRNAVQLMANGKIISSYVSLIDTLLRVDLVKSDTIADGTSKEYRLMLNLPDTLPDGFSVAFSFNETTPLFTASNSSVIGDLSLQKGRTIRADAVAERFRMEPSHKDLLKGQKIAPYFYAIDCFGNVDVEFSQSCELEMVGSESIKRIKNGSRGVVDFDSIAVTGEKYLFIKLSSENISAFEQKIVLLNDTTSVVSGVVKDTLVATVKNVSPDAGVEIASFYLKDTGGDKLPTAVRSFNFSISSSKVDASKVIAGATLRVGNESRECRIAQLSKDLLQIEVFDGTLSIKDGDSAAVRLGLYLSPEEFVDLGVLSFKIKGVVADSIGSLFASFQPISVNTIKVHVQADTLSFSKVPSAVKPNTFFDVTVRACDRFGNTDADYEGFCKLVIAGASVVTHTQKFSSGVAKFVGIKLAKSGEYSIDASAEGLKTLDKFIVADDDSFLKVSNSPFPSVSATSTSNFVDVLKFLVVDTGVSDTLCTRITQLSLHGVDTLGKLLSTRRIESLRICLNGRPVDFSSIFFTGGKVTLKFADSVLVIPNRSEGEVVIKIQLSKVTAMTPFYLSLPADGVLVGFGSSRLSKTYSYPIRSSIINYTVVAEQILLVPHPTLVALETLLRLKCQISNREGDVVTSFAGKVAIEQEGFSEVKTVVSNGTISIESLKATSIGNASIRIVVNDTISEKVSFKVARQVDTLVAHGTAASIIEGWRRMALGGYVHSGGEGRSLLCYSISPSVNARNVQWHFRFRLDNSNFSSENFMRIVLLTDRVPYKDSSYAAVVLSYKKAGGKSFFQLENVVNGRVISCSDTIYTDRIEGRLTEAYIYKDIEGYWMGSVYADGYQCCHFESVKMPFVKVAEYCGIEYQCSSSNVGKMQMESFDFVGSEQYLRIVEGYYSSKGNAVLTVNQPLTSADGISLTATNYKGSSFSISDVQADGGKLYFRMADPKESSYGIKIEQRVNGQTISDTATIHIRSGLEFGDVAISEVMFDPTPSVGLPEVEYLELYNRVADTLLIDGWTVRVNGKVWRCNHAKINPKGYLAISSVSGASALGMYGNAASASYFDGFPNDGADIAVLNSQGKIIAASYYSSEFLSKEGAEGGVSLEKLDISSTAECRENWAASEDVRGGTPGFANSISGKVVDTEPPIVEKLSVSGVNTVSITFNEPVVVGQGFSIMLDNRRVEATLKHSKESERAICIILSRDLELNVSQLLVIADVADYSGNVFTLPIQVARCEPPVKGDLTINEVLFNPEGDCSDYVELVNISGKPIDLSSVVLCRRNAEGKLDERKRVSETSFILRPQEYVLLCSTPEVIALIYPRSNPTNFKKLRSMPSLPNDAGVVVVADTALNVIDEFAYSERMHFRMLPTFDGVSLERINFNESKWQSASKEVNYGTPGAENSQLLKKDDSKRIIKLAASVISPDGDGVNDYLAMSYHLKSAGTMADVGVFTGSGVLVKKLCRNELLGTEGTVVWDGITDNGTRASRGIYILVSKLVYSDGNCEEVRQVFAVAYR